MTDAELTLVEELVAALRAGRSIDVVAVGLDPTLVEVAAQLTGEFAEVGALSGQALPAGFGAVWQGVAALGGVGASGAAGGTLVAGAGGGAGGPGGGGAVGLMGSPNGDQDGGQGPTVVHVTDDGSRADAREHFDPGLPPEPENPPMAATSVTLPRR